MTLYQLTNTQLWQNQFLFCRKCSTDQVSRSRNVNFTLSRPNLDTMHIQHLCFTVKECQREWRLKNSAVVPCDVLHKKKDLWGLVYRVVHWCGVGIIRKMSFRLGLGTTWKISKNFGTRLAELLTSYTKKHGKWQAMFLYPGCLTLANKALWVKSSQYSIQYQHEEKTDRKYFLMHSGAVSIILHSWAYCRVIGLFEEFNGTKQITHSDKSINWH